VSRELTAPPSSRLHHITAIPLGVLYILGRHATHYASKLSAWALKKSQVKIPSTQRTIDNFYDDVGIIPDLRNGPILNDNLVRALEHHSFHSLRHFSNSPLVIEQLSVDQYFRIHSST
jgi:hypothetical protein